MLGLGAGLQAWAAQALTRARDGQDLSLENPGQILRFLLLAGPLAKALGLPLSPQLLWRTRLDPPQSSLDRKARLLGPKGAFGAHDLVRGRRVVLLDDIMTTGATLREATRTLLAQGAADVSIVVLARTPSSTGPL